MSIRVCLINPPHPYLRQPRAQAPLGLLYIAAALREASVPVTLVDLSAHKYTEDFELPDAEVYGLTGTVLDRRPCMVVTEHIRRWFPTAKVVIGGPITLTPEYLGVPVDAMVKGEGEREILRVLLDYPELKPVYQAERILDLDSLPFPARDMVPVIGGNVFAFNKNYLPGGSTVIITSRGCPYNCAFCASPGIWNRRVIFRNVANVLAEVADVIERFGVRQLRFSDDTLTLKRRRLSELCAGLKQRDVVWRASIRVVPNSLEMFQEMYDGGCREVSFGVESADDNVLRVLRKGVTAEDNRTAILNAKRAGMVVRILFMTGTPGETAATTDTNIRFLEEMKDSYDTVALTNFIPIPGSAIVSAPEDFDCDVVCDDVDRFNFYMWGPEGLNEWEEFIRLHHLDPDVLKDNKERLRQYVVQSGKSNTG